MLPTSHCQSCGVMLNFSMHVAKKFSDDASSSALDRIYACPRSVFPGLMSEDAQPNHFYVCLGLTFSDINGSGNLGFAG